MLGKEKTYTKEEIKEIFQNVMFEVIQDPIGDEEAKEMATPETVVSLMLGSVIVLHNLEKKFFKQL